jgi:hypothetical protein
MAIDPLHSLEEESRRQPIMFSGEAKTLNLSPGRAALVNPSIHEKLD